MHVALLLSHASNGISRSPAVLNRAECADDPRLIATIDGCDYTSQAPSAEEMLFYDLLYAHDATLAGIELRTLDDHVRHAFATETDGFLDITWGVFPTVWLGITHSGEPKPSTVELFGDLWLCRSRDGQWSIVIDLDGVLSRTVDLGVLRVVPRATA